MPAFDENRVRQRNPNRFSCRCRILDGRIPSLDRSHTGAFVIGRKDNVIAYSESSRLYSAGYNPALIKSIDVLDSKPEGTVSLRCRRRKPVECAHKGRTRVPFRNTVQRLDQIQSFTSRDWNKPERLDPEFPKKIAVFLLNLLINSLGKIYQIHLIDEDDHLIYAKHAQKISVPLTLLLHTFVRRNQQQCRVRVRSASYHIFEKLFMPRRIDDHV